MSEPEPSAERILEAARAIRSYLPTLLDASSAAQTDAALAALIADPGDTGDVEERILGEFERHDATAEWAAAFLEHGLPLELVRHGERGFYELAGHGEPVRTPKFACPDGDYVWYRHAVGQSPPVCPTHHKVVEPVTAE